MSLAQALFMGLLQGATELFPVSSLGHAVLIPSLLHWSFKQSDPSFVPFLVLLHLGTAGALLFIYRSQWVDIIKGFFTAALRGGIETPTERLAMLLMVGTIPAAILGVFFETRIKSLFASPYVAAGFLIVNGILMLSFEQIRRRAERNAVLDSKPRIEQEERFAEAERISFPAAALARRGIEVDRHKIDLEEPLKTLGTYKVAIKVFTGMTPEVTVIVEPKG